MSRPMVFNFFVMNTPSHITHGTWRMPQSRGVDYNDLSMWVDLARTAERAKVDAIFFADVFGLYGDHGGTWEALARHAIQFPISDPSMLISAMAHATSDLSYIYTNSVLQQHPFSFARGISTLDHLTRGRVGWNIVTSASANGSRSMGLPNITDHDERYRWADEYVDVTYKLWEGSWEDEAVLADRDAGVYADPARIHKINHVGERYSVEGPHLVEPSPQRVPALFQAGASDAGLNFAARHAEGIFMVSGSVEGAQRKIEKVREIATANGREADDILFLEGLTFVVGSTEEEARRKEAELEEWLSDEAQMVVMSGVSGIDLAHVDADTPLSELIASAPGMQGSLKMVMDSMPAGQVARVRDMANFSTRRWRIVGTPETIADRIEAYRDVGVGGVNVMYMTLPGTFEDFADHIAPELQRRGLMQSDYRPGTLREKLFPGRDATINARHPAAAYRR